MYRVGPKRPRGALCDQHASRAPMSVGQIVPTGFVWRKNGPHGVQFIPPVVWSAGTHRAGSKDPVA
jgi:hypothetical protein